MLTKGLNGSELARKPYQEENGTDNKRNDMREENMRVGQWMATQAVKE
jgi:hypothetical protein